MNDQTLSRAVAIMADDKTVESVTVRLNNGNFFVVGYDEKRRPVVVVDDEHNVSPA